MSEVYSRTRINAATLRRLQRFAKLRASGLTVTQAGEQIGVTSRTATRYSSHLHDLGSRMTIQLDYLPNWQGVGPCVDYPAVMYPGIDETTLRLARAICQGCPVLRSCRRWVLGLPPSADPGGVVAGLTLAERGRALEGDIEGKQCTRCDQLKPFTEFSLVARAGTKLRSHCKTCCAQETRDAYAARRLTGCPS